MTADPSPPLDTFDDPPARPFDAPTGRLAPYLAAAAVAFVAAFWPDWRWLWGLWTTQPDYSHGLIIVPLALVILWRRLDEATDEGGPWEPARVGWLLALLAVAARAYLYQKGNFWAAAAMMLPTLAGLVLALGGWGLMGRVYPALLYLGFMYPIPTSLHDRLSRPLQSMATTASAGMLKILGFWVLVEGNVLHVGSFDIGVEEACNGLAMLVCLIATVTAVVLLVPLRPWQRLLLLLGAVPVALLCNVLRIVATAYAYRDLGVERGAHFAHDVAGWLMMPLAVALVGLQIAVLRWLVVEERTIEEPMILGNPIPSKRPDDEGPSEGVGEGEDVVEGDEPAPEAGDEAKPKGLPVPGGPAAEEHHEPD